MIPAKYNIQDQYRNDTTDYLQFNFQLDDIDNTPINLTGVSLKTEFRKGGKAGSVVKTISDGLGITVIDAINGIIKFDTFIIDWVAADYSYDIQLTFPDGTVKTYIEGVVKVIEDVTK
jgi:hypothetical protein